MVWSSTSSNSNWDTSTNTVTVTIAAGGTLVLTGAIWTDLTFYRGAVEYLVVSKSNRHVPIGEDFYLRLA